MLTGSHLEGADLFKAHLNCGRPGGDAAAQGAVRPAWPQEATPALETPPAREAAASDH